MVFRVRLESSLLMKEAEMEPGPLITYSLPAVGLIGRKEHPSTYIFHNLHQGPRDLQNQAHIFNMHTNSHMDMNATQYYSQLLSY